MQLTQIIDTITIIRHLEDFKKLGKSKKRIISKGKNQCFDMQMTREQALMKVYEELCINPASITAKKIITLFGLKAEELSENGVNYEVLRALDNII